MIVTPRSLLESNLILTLTAVLLFSGSAVMTAARLNNRKLIGLGWLGLSLASGGVGVTLFLKHGIMSVLPAALLTDLFVLLAVVLLHVGVLEVAASPSLFPMFGVVLLTFQLGSEIFQIYEGTGSRSRVAVLGFLIAGQLGETAIHLFRIARHGGGLPARFTASILGGAATISLLQSFMTIFGVPFGQGTMNYTRDTTIIAYTVAMLGVAFGFFWTSTTVLASGLEYMAGTDPLTRLFNRRVFLIWCEKEQLRSKKTGIFFSILMIDLDHFKRINDTFGHHTGDLALCAAVEKIQDAMRGIDVIGRWGGEEFAALLPGANNQAAHLVAERVRRNIEKVSLPAAFRVEGSGPNSTNITASVGIATHLSAEDTVHAMMQRADKALFVAKANGRNRIAG
jgi:diguanylate cyclase (GGDEF)-like protein